MVLAIYGSGGLGREVLDLAREINDVSKHWDDIIFIDDTKVAGEIINDCKTYPFEYFVNNFKIEDTEIAIALGEPNHREILYEKVTSFGFKLATLVHPNAHIGFGTKLAPGVIVSWGTFVSCNTVIGENCVVLQNCVVAHDCVIGKHCVIAPNTAVAGNCYIGNKCYIGIGATLKEKSKVGDGVIVSLGSIVYKNVPDGAVFMSEPGRIIGVNNGQKIFK